MEDPEAFRAAVRAHAAAMLNDDASPYDPALEIWGLAMREWPGDDGDEACYSLQLIWGALTDWVELRPAETDQAETHMITAAREWLTIEGDRKGEARYFDRWVHDILGYERPAPAQT
ncbi:hypothetical protein OHA33_37095 [Streptomyces sp. NBC_00562]|uniref:hypothetical protein n=1 Tax=Streptomyces sp. NBC_00562 TaxID=2975777 RepID=UPI002E808A1D|nr:hypothetical protein [Streptomyces sp. NBC_00562]WUC24011.1 hypothetical protein OHA33_37095 [Streptomyces sp. NBC_00562]